MTARILRFALNDPPDKGGHVFVLIFINIINIMTESEIKNLLREYGIRPSKSKGQNFLIDQNVLQKILMAADLNQDDCVLEIGPGFGILTEKLVGRTRKVLAVELDKKLHFYLKKKFKQTKNLEILAADILKINNENLNKKLTGGQGSYKVVANLPYAITKPVLRKFLSYEPKPKELVVLIQKEVAAKIMARHGKMSILALSVHYYGQPELMAIVPKESFFPRPQVESAILKIKIYSALPKEVISILAGDLSRFSEKKFWQLVKIGFSSPRKQLQNNLAAGLNLSKEEAKKKLELAGFNEKIRAEDLSLAGWVKLYLKFVP